ncbi:MAG TPA: SRPBCC domain-containing protein [Candidatus Dormibacteraeota bacterium]|nr:SRPBCC domain-containing protein [Candidatus Dormibacteraeota bacterium]
MSKGFVAEKQVTIKASADAVWQALTDPALVKQYLHGTKMETNWKVGSPITWKGEWKGKPYEDKGTVLAVKRKRLLKTTHWSPMGGSEDKPENYHTVTYELAERGDTTVLTLKQDNNASQEEANTMAEKNWGPVLEGLKAVAEQEPSG